MLQRLLLDVAARVFIPVTAVDDHDGEPCEHSFLVAALGRLLLGFLCHGVCLAGARGIAGTILRFTENILTEDHGGVSEVLRQLEAAGMKQAIGGAPGVPHHRVAAPLGQWWCVAARAPGAPASYAPPHHTAVMRSARTIAPHRTTAVRSIEPHRRAPAVRSPRVAAPRRGAPRPGGLLHHTLP
ncbi:hypothetical protein [Streptomyces youssoufiensis]